MFTNHTQSGYSLIEVLIALTILMIAIVAPITIAIKSLESSTYSLEQNTAVFLAQESVSIIEALRNQYALENLNDNQFDDVDPYWSDWVDELDACLESAGHGCNFDAQEPSSFIDDSDNIVSCTEAGDNCRLYSNSEWSNPVYRVVNVGGGEPSPFIRRVYFDSATDSELIVRVVVEWESEFLNQTQQVSITTALYNVYGSSFVQ